MKKVYASSAQQQIHANAKLKVIFLNLKLIYNS